MPCSLLTVQIVLLEHVLKSIKLVALIIFVMLVGLGAYFWTPDLSKDKVREQYASVESMFFQDSLGNKVHYRDQGTKDGDVLMLIHGTSASLHTWEPLVRELKSNYRLVSFDLPGHGLTGETVDRRYDSGAYIRTLVDLMTHLNLSSATLIGNSLGGRIAWQAALLHPDKVKSLVLLAPSGAKRVTPAGSNIGFKIMNSAIGRYLSLRITPKILIRRSLEQTVVDKDLVTDSMVDRYWQLLRMEGNRRAMSEVFGARRTESDSVANSVIVPINTPKLVLWGEQDRILPINTMEQFESVWSNDLFYRISDVGHLPQEEALGIVVDQLNSFCRLHSC